MQLHSLGVAEVDALIVVIYGHGQGDLGLLLADDILIQHGVDLLGRGDHIGHAAAAGLVHRLVVVVQNAHAQLHTLVADIDTRPGDEPPDLILMLAAKGAADIFLLVVTRHGYTS